MLMTLPGSLVCSGDSSPDEYATRRRARLNATFVSLLSARGVEVSDRVSEGIHVGMRCTLAFIVEIRLIRLLNAPIR